MPSMTVRLGTTQAKAVRDEAERIATADTYVVDAAVAELMKLPARDRDRAIRDAANKRRRRNNEAAAA